MPDPSPIPQETPCGGDREALREQVKAMEETISIRQQGEGAYSLDLADPVGELGTLHSSLCNHPAALDAYRRAVQLLRINEGLLTEAQLPYLRAMADSSQAIGDYESAQLTLRYGFRIHNMGRGMLSQAALRDSLGYFRRAREVFIDPRLPGDVELFFQAVQDNQFMWEVQLSGFQRGEGSSYEAIKSLGISHLRNLYLILGTELRATQSSDGSGVGWDNLLRTQQLSYGKGRVVLEELLALPAAQTPQEQSYLLLRLGNWQQWNGKWQSSCDSYAKAWAAAGDDSSPVRRQLAAPAELPEDPQLWSYLLDPALPEKAVVEAQFRVSARGDISRVSGEALDDASSGIAGRILRWLRDSHARPAVVGGECVAAPLSGRRYRVID